MHFIFNINRSKGDSETNQNFNIDLQDPRFEPLLSGDAKYGIDLTSSEYKETEAMKAILAEQRRRRKKRGSDTIQQEQYNESQSSTQNGEIAPLVKKLKMKFGSLRQNSR